MKLKAKKCKLLEASLGRLNTHLANKVPMVFIRADRSENSDDINKKNFSKLKEYTVLAGFSYNKVIGGFVEKTSNGTVDVTENSWIV